MKHKQYEAAVELSLLALALFWFVPHTRAMGTYLPDAAYVLVCMSASRFFSYRSGRSRVVCISEVGLVTAAFVLQRWVLGALAG